MFYGFKIGDPVIFVVSKSSSDPGPRAKGIYPAPAGDTYSYMVEKFWTVAEIRPNNHLLLVTRRGKQHDVAVDDPRLRPARWWERWLYKKRFPLLNPSVNVASTRSE